LFVTAALLAVRASNLDLWLADQWFALEGYNWSLRDNWISYELIHHHGKQMLIGFAVVLLCLLVLSYFMGSLKKWRRPLFYLLTSMAVILALIAYMKHFSPVACPWDLVRYGGELQYQPTFSHAFGLTVTGHCFPAGHASGGFALLAVYFAAYQYARRPALFLIPGLLVGTVFAVGQQSRGAHFLSHDLWSLSLCWFGALGMFLLFRPQNWPAASRPARAREANADGS
jgi:membrane-associated PAP2 superfamily phosphatase